MEAIEGRVTGAQPGQRIVLFARSGKWWVQPFASQPFTTIERGAAGKGANDGATWKSSTHPGSAYAALLVDARYHPPPTLSALPEAGGPVLAAATVQGRTPTAFRTLQFSGYTWEIREAASDPGGSTNFYDPANAWADSGGLLHLRIVKQAGRWISSEVRLSRSLGYGVYRFVVRDVSQLEPAAVFAMFPWDDAGPSREMDIEISRWGEPEDKNAQYVVQPYVVPANTVRFMAPSGTLTYWIDWEPGRVEFKTARGAVSNADSKADSNVVADHVFSSGVPSPGTERIHMNLYVYNNQSNPLQRGSEVIVEKFEFLP
jgi:hypothetical protein